MAKESKIVKSEKESKYSTRDNNRCSITGRSRGYMRYFGICRHKFRELALKGQLPGVKKASW